ncbi:MAG: serine hydrolase domain-containing protein [Acidimicrobiales bacterium]
MSELNSALVSRLDEVLEARVTELHCPSVVATLFQGEAELWHAGSGQTSIGAGPPGPDTVYRIASCSKSFTATVLLILRDRGLVNFDAPITDFVPEFTQAVGERLYDPPTIRMLMSMSGGLPTDDPWADRQESITSRDLRRIVQDGVHLTTAPGTRFQYSNLGYALLGQVIEAVTGRPFRDVVNEEVLSPLELHDTGYEKEIVADDRLARGYRQGPDGWVELAYSNPGAFSGIGGLFSSARDLARWVRWHASASDHDAPGSGPLSKSSRREMHQIVTAISHPEDLAGTRANHERHFGYGLGFFSEFDTRLGQFVSHSGGYPGFSSHMRWHPPTGLGVVVLENATYSGAWDTATGLMEAVLEAADFHLPGEMAWEMTTEMAQRASSLIRRWDDAAAAVVFEENVALDIPYVERRAQIEGLVADVGGLRELDDARFHDVRSDSPLHMTWTMPAERGSLRCEIRLSPRTPSLIQTFKVSKVATESLDE